MSEKTQKAIAKREAEKAKKQQAKSGTPRKS